MVSITNRTKVRVKTAKYKSKSSVKWLQRQLNDPFVKKAHELGYRSRATFKIIEIDDKFHLFKHGKKVVDIGSAPGGWSDIAVRRVGKGNVAAIDILEMKPIDGVKFKQIDFFFSEIFINSYFIILCIILYIPILIGSYMYTKYYIDKKNIIKPKSYIINFLLIFFIIISAYLLYSFWFIIYVYLF